MEGAEPRHAFDRVADHLADALLHFARRLVGEGHREDLGWPGAAETENMRDAGGQNPGLAGTGAGEHEEWPIERLNGGALLAIEPREVGCAHSGACAGSDAIGGGRRHRLGWAVQVA